MISKIAHLTFSLVVLVGVTSSLAGQSGEPKLEEYSFEGLLPLDSVSSPSLPSLPQEVVDSVRAGSLEVRVREQYMSLSGYLTSQLFVAPVGAPLPLVPTPPVASPETLRFLNVKVDQVIMSDKLVPSTVLLGKVVFAVGQMTGPGLVGATSVTAFGYEEGTPAKFMLWGSTVPGWVVTHVPLALGSLNVVKPPPPPPPPTNQPPVAVIFPETQTVILPFLTLDGSKSFDPDGDPITFSWRSIGQPVTILAPTSPTPEVQFQGRAYYTFELTVTDDKGLTGKTTCTVLYVGQ